MDQLGAAKRQPTVPPHAAVLRIPDRIERMSSNNDRRAILDAFGVSALKTTRDWTDRQLDDAHFALCSATIAALTASCGPVIPPV